jgi:hypothetical protein
METPLAIIPVDRQAPRALADAVVELFTGIEGESVFQ